MPFGPKLAGERVVLRASVPSDVEQRAQLGRHAEIARMFGASEPRTAAMPVEEAEAWFASVGVEGTVAWVVESHGSFLGSVGLHSFDAEKGSARFAIGFFDPERLGLGLGAEVTQLVLTYAFDVLDLRTISLAVLEFNERAIACYRKCGFRDVGRTRDAAVVNGVAYDDVLMEISR